jgi:beta-lactam-binding protein with PASTA domain
MRRIGLLVALGGLVGSLTALPSSAQDMATMPDVRFMPVDQALETLRHAGFTRIEEATSNLCGSVIDDRIVEMGQVCQQSVRAGRPVLRAGTIRLTVQREDPRKGYIGEGREWRLLPRTEGMTEEQAVAALHEAGFTDRERIDIRYVSDFNCQSGRVCRMYPPGYSRTALADKTRLIIGK